MWSIDKKYMEKYLILKKNPSFAAPRMIIMTKPKVYSNEMDYYFSQFIFTHWNKIIYWMKTKTVNLYEKN